MYYMYICTHAYICIHIHVIIYKFRVQLQATFPIVLVSRGARTVLPNSSIRGSRFWPRSEIDGFSQLADLTDGTMYGDHTGLEMPLAVQVVHTKRYWLEERLRKYHKISVVVHPIRYGWPH